MLILARDRAKAPDRGYAKTFLTQLEECLGIALDRGVRIVANAGGLNPAGLATAVRSLAERLGLDVHVAHVEGDDLVAAGRRPGVRHAAGGQRLPRRVGHRRLPERRRRRRRHRPGHRRLGDRRARRRPLRLGPHRLRRAGRCGGRGPRHRMRHPGHRRQLLVLHRSRRPDLRRLPARRDPRRRIVGDHQAPRDRRAGQRRHRHRATALRDHRRALRQPRCDAARRHHRAVRRRPRPGADRRRGGRAAAADAEGVAEQHRRIPQRDDVRADRAWTSRPRPSWCSGNWRPADRQARRAGVDAGPHRPSRRRHRGGGQRAAALRGA